MFVHMHDRYHGPPGAARRWSDNLAFRWEITIDDVSHESAVSVRADNASERGVPFPAAWRVELNIGAMQPVVNVDDLAREACQRACEELSLPEGANLDCRPPYESIISAFVFLLVCVTIHVYTHASARS